MIQQVVVKRERWLGAYKGKMVSLVQIHQEVVPHEPVLRVERKEDAGRAGRTTSDLESQGDSVAAGLYGRVVGFTPRGGVVIESRAVQMRGIVGAGLPVAGPLTIWQSPRPGRAAQTIPPGAILVVPEPLTFTLLRQAISSGVGGMVASSIALRDLEGFLRTDVLQLLIADNIELAQTHLPPFTLLCTEGVGSFMMPGYLLNFLRQCEGSIGLLTGITSVRHHISPDLIISSSVAEVEGGEWQLPRPDPTLFPGIQVRVCGGEYEGMIGLIDHFFVHEQMFRAGIRVRAVRLHLENGAFCIVPLTSIERI